MEWEVATPWACSAFLAEGWGYPDNRHDRHLFLTMEGGTTVSGRKRFEMSLQFTDGGLLERSLRRLWHLAIGGRRHWHNRVFSRSQSIERSGDGWVFRWGGRQPVAARRIEDLPRLDSAVSIVASGPSVRELRQPARFFERPVACVNGSIALADELGRRADYLFVNDYRFVLDKVDLFRVGLETADHVVLGPIATFAAMLVVPELLAGAPLYFRDDLLRPFKRPRPTVAELRADPSVIVHPEGGVAYSLDVGRGVCSSGTVVFDAIQTLFGRGYREIAMFGVDLSDTPRFYAEQQPAPNDLRASYELQIRPAFELVEEYVRRSGRVLVNGSPRSRLPSEIVPKAEGERLLDAVVAGRPLRETVTEEPGRVLRRVA